MIREPELSDSDWQALTTYVFDVPNEAQTTRVEALLAGPLGESVHREIAALRDLGGTSSDKLDHQAAWQHVASQLTKDIPQRSQPQSQRQSQRRSRFQWTLAGVASACVAAAAIFVGVHEHKGSSSPHTTEDGGYAVATRSAQRTEITLADGTQVLLNVASRIEIPKDFGVDQRRVILHGQAVFRVAHMAHVPFSVHAAGTHIKVLGTEFGVRAYDTKQPVSIAVRSGRVGVGSAVLQAGDIGEARFGNSVSVAHQQNVDAAFDFTTGQLTFNKSRLQDIIPDLNRWYDVDIRLGSPTLADRRVSGNLKSGGVESLVEVFREVFNLRVDRNGRVVTLYENQ